MQGSSRSALVTTRQALNGTFADSLDPSVTAVDLFQIVDMLDDNATLRRAFADPTRDAAAKRGLVQRLLGGKIDRATMIVLDAAVSQRWSAERDLSDALETLAVEAATASAERAGRADAVENELFRYERAVAGDPDLRDALADRQRSGAQKAGLTGQLLSNRVSPETLLLAQRAASGQRDRTFERTVEMFLSAIAHRRGQSQAVITTAVELTSEQTTRLQNALSKMYGKPVQTNVVVDPRVVGGIRVQIGDDVIDGTIARRLDEARAHLSG